jgi:hypothetical protein
MTFRLARPKIREAFKPAGPPPIIAQSNSNLFDSNYIFYMFNCRLLYRKSSC